MKTNKKNGFGRFYVIYLAALAALSAAFLLYVRAVSKEYADAQPENAVRAEVDKLVRGAQEGTLDEIIDFTALCENGYEQNDPESLRKQFEDRLINGEITIEGVMGGSNENSRQFSILSDNSPIGRITLSSENNRTKLFFFSMADWKTENFEAIPTGTVYNLRICQPDGTKLLINGREPSAEDMEEKEPVPVFAINGLLNEPVIEYSDSSGNSVPYALDGDRIIPLLYNCKLQFPESISVTLNGAAARGEKNSDGQLVYDIREMNKPEITLSDPCGKKLDFDITDSVTLYDYSISVPENVSVTVNGIPADSICPAQATENPDAALLMKHAGVTLPALKQYSFSLLSENAEAVVSDGAKSRSYTLDNHALILNGVSGTDEVPEDIGIDVLETAKTWSKFMTADLSGAYYGLDEIRKYLIAGSDYYTYAGQWATGTDITFTTPHSIDGFTGESVTDYIRYSEDCFSCHVYFEKQMTIYANGNFVGTRTDVFNSIMYFVYIDDTPDNGANDPHWAIAVMHDVI